MSTQVCRSGPVLGQEDVNSAVLSTKVTRFTDLTGLMHFQRLRLSNKLSSELSQKDIQTPGLYETGVVEEQKKSRTAARLHQQVVKQLINI